MKDYDSPCIYSIYIHIYIYIFFSLCGVNPPRSLGGSGSTGAVGDAQARHVGELLASIWPSNDQKQGQK